MKNVTIAIVAIVVIAVAAVLFTQSQKSQTPVPQQTEVTQAPAQEAQPTNGAMKEGAVKELTMTAKQWEFSPATLTVKQGDKVKLTIKSLDVDHGIAIPEFNVNSTLEPGKDTVVEFTTSKKGEFNFFCSVLCGKGHKDMTGKIIVE